MSKPHAEYSHEDDDYRGLYVKLPIGWSSDWNGDEVGYPDVPVVGLYIWEGVNMYINMDNMKVLESWVDEDELDSGYLYVDYDAGDSPYEREDV